MILISDLHSMNHEVSHHSMVPVPNHDQIQHQIVSSQNHGPIVNSTVQPLNQHPKQQLNRVARSPNHQY
jgi:muconolactone delta-isomerase